MMFDPYRPGHSLIHRLDARVKVGWAVAFIIATALTPPRAWPIWILWLALAWVAVILAELRAGFVFSRSLVALPLVLAALPLLFTVKGTPWFTLPWGWQASWEGGLRAFNIAGKAWLSLWGRVSVNRNDTL